ncbi:MAG: FAD-dependent oxidoreductase [Thermoplasmata archaeon]|nr:FAD-dependent oxidoreductase [Thermoplasmata archaeon]
MADREFELAIVGGGPAAFAAGIYAGRSGVKAAILEKMMPGGQMALSYLIENWPGEKEISGQDLTMKMREHAEQYSQIIEFTEITSIKKDGDLFVLGSVEGDIRAKAVILATGAEHRKLGATGEEEFIGKGISYCATCDGFFFKGKKVLVVGGGNTALEYAVYLNNIECDVTLVHRRDTFRAEKRLQDQVKEAGIDTIMGSVVEEFTGGETLKAARLRNVKTDEIIDFEISGSFIAVGEIPNNELAKALGLDLDESGYVKIDREGRTSMPRIYGAGDVTGGLKQVVVAAAEGAVAATTAFEDLTDPYWTK